MAMQPASAAERFHALIGSMSSFATSDRPRSAHRSVMLRVLP